MLHIHIHIPINTNTNSISNSHTASSISLFGYVKYTIQTLYSYIVSCGVAWLLSRLINMVNRSPENAQFCILRCLFKSLRGFSLWFGFFMGICCHWAFCSILLGAAWVANTSGRLFMYGLASIYTVKGSSNVNLTFYKLFSLSLLDNYLHTLQLQEYSL